MPFLELFDETLDINSTENYELALQVSPDELSFCLLDTIRNKFVLIRSFKPEDNRYFSIDALKDLINNDDFLIWKQEYLQYKSTGSSGINWTADFSGQRKADLAVGCTYKYLNGGPGSPAYLYVRQDLQELLLPPIWGWWAQRAPFDFDLDFKPAVGMNRFLVSSPPVLSMLAMP